MCRELVRSGADCNYASHANSGGQGRSRTMLCYWIHVVRSGDVDWAREMIDKHQADVNWPMNSAVNSYRGQQYGMQTLVAPTALQVAVQVGEERMVQLLLERGADVNLTECCTVDQLKYYATERDEDCSAYITDAGAFGSFVPATDTMSTAVASGGKQGAIIKMLKDAGAKEEEKGRMFVKFSWSFLDGC